jgi:hypothetical protein
MERDTNLSQIAGFIVILPLAVLSVWSIYAIRRWVWREKFGPKWRRNYFILAALGLALGVKFTFFSHYQMANARLDGFPIPTGIATRQKPEDAWEVSNMPSAVRLGGQLTDLLSGIALCLAPVAVAAFFKENRSQGPVPNPPV